MFKKILNTIRASLNGNTNDPSTVRIQSYLVLLPILIMIVVFLTIEIWRFIHYLKIDKDFILSNEIIIVFFGVLSHHLAVLFQRNKSQSITSLKDGLKDVNEESINKEQLSKNEEPNI